MLAILLCVALLACREEERRPAPSAKTSTSCDSVSFATFWSGFRSAILSGELAAVQGAVADSFAIRGTMDSDSLVRVTPNEFRERWATLLQQDPGLRAEPETLREYVERTVTIPARAVDPSQSIARIADLVFQCGGGRWQLSRAYSSD